MRAVSEPVKPLPFSKGHVAIAISNQDKDDLSDPSTLSILSAGEVACESPTHQIYLSSENIPATEV